jgi:tripartite-type tricarboxylate transporter receptor subunit TctC
VALAKKSPGKLAYASTGIGSSAHLAGELFGQRAGIDLVHVPYKGGSAAMIDLLGSRIEAYYSTPSSAASHIQSKKLIAIATTGLTRSEGLASLPTIAESGYPDFNATNWYAYVAPAKTPTAILDRWNTEFVKVLTTPSVRDALLAMGLIPDPMTRQGLADYMAKESATWKSARFAWPCASKVKPQKRWPVLSMRHNKGSIILKAQPPHPPWSFQATTVRASCPC